MFTPYDDSLEYIYYIMIETWIMDQINCVVIENI